MSVTRRLGHAPAAFALVLAALALGWAGGTHLGASTDAGGATSAPSGSWLEPSSPDQPAVTVGADERVDARADRWRQGGLLALLTAAVAVPLLGGWSAGARRLGPPHTPDRWSTVAARAPPRGAVLLRALTPA